MNVMLNSPKQLYRIAVRGRTVPIGCFALLSMTFFFISVLPTAAQQPAPQVYTYVEQMPQLPGGGGTAAIWGDVMKRLKLPADKIEPSCYRTAIYFEVNPTGVVQRSKVTAGSKSALIDSALLTAVRSLPRLHPGYQQGKPVTVSFTIPFSIATQ